MDAWNVAVGWLAQAVAVASGLFGGNIAAGVVAISVALRLLLLPWTVRLALRADQLRRVRAELEPELTALRARFAADPQRAAQEELALYRRRGVSPFDARALALTAVQLPLASALSQAIRQVASLGRRWLWIVDLSRPDVALAAMFAALSAAVAAVNAQPSLPWRARVASIVLPALVSGWIAFRLSSALTLSWASSTVVSAVEGWAVRRYAARRASKFSRQ